MSENPPTTLKPHRRRLAKSELLLHLAVTAEGWSTALKEAGTGEGAKRRPAVDEWGPDDPLAILCRTYGLTPAELAGLCTEIGTELEQRALRGGYDEHWDSEGVRLL